MGKPKLLDAFCKAGGAGMGYHQAGFEVVGVDIEPQPRYPFEFVQGDALKFIAEHGQEFDVIHASPPCQGYSVLKNATGKTYPRLIAATRSVIKAINKPYIIENVEGAKDEMIAPVLLCGVMFGMRLYRHRLFESNIVLPHPVHKKHQSFSPRKRQGHPNGGGFFSIAGHSFRADAARQVMQIDWMNRNELAQAIPPAYTKWLGRRLIETLHLRTANNKIQRELLPLCQLGLFSPTNTL